MANEVETDRRRLFQGVAGSAWAGIAGSSAGVQAPPGRDAQPQTKRLGMKITAVEPILTGRGVFVKIQTDAGITGYGDATNNFIPYS